jgi:L,D-peptidoglycan transpeptidase YkuD (ErfK/YbiS/YcfS/YnhG family)
MSRIEVNSSGVLTFMGITYTCAVGRGGVAANKREGDGTTPIGEFSLRRVFYRSDRLDRPQTGLPVRGLRKEDGWCDDPGDEHYNQLVTLPYAARSELMWREDNLYDIITVIGFNDLPPVYGRGSAIFLHVAATDFSPTEGCLALAMNDLLAVLRNSTGDTQINISA